MFLRIKPANYLESNGRADNPYGASYRELGRPRTRLKKRSRELMRFYRGNSLTAKQFKGLMAISVAFYIRELVDQRLAPLFNKEHSY